jgi:hypothetical protein
MVRLSVMKKRSMEEQTRGDEWVEVLLRKSLGAMLHTTQ